MKKIPTASIVVAAAAAVALVAGPAHAAAPTKVWVANAGVDNATCGAVTAPCATFHQAIANVSAGGEIGVLDPGDYGFVLFAKSASITNDGAGEAAVLNGAVTINAGVGDVVGLRGLIVDGLGGGASGIAFIQGSALHAQNCVVRNFQSPGFGIEFNPSVNSQLFLSDSLIYNNGSNAQTAGIIVQPHSTGSATVVLDRVHLENNVIGLRVDGGFSSGNGVHVIVRDSVVSGNAGDGIAATTFSGKPPAFLVIERSTLVNNAGIGIHAQGPGATVLLSDSTISRNGVGVSAVSGGQLISYGNNRNNNNLGPEGTATGFFSPF